MVRSGKFHRFMRMKRREGERGFTLLEVLVVSSMIGILAGIAIPSLAGARKSALQSACVKALRSITDAEEMYYRDNLGYTDNWLALDNYLPIAYSGYTNKRFFVENYSLYFKAVSNFQRYSTIAFPTDNALRLSTFQITDEAIPMTPVPGTSPIVWEPA